jgi:hypothetical protein
MAFHVDVSAHLRFLAAIDNKVISEIPVKYGQPSVQLTVPKRQRYNRLDGRDACLTFSPRPVRLERAGLSINTFVQFALFSAQLPEFEAQTSRQVRFRHHRDRALVAIAAAQGEILRQAA